MGFEGQFCLWVAESRFAAVEINSNFSVSVIGLSLLMLSGKLAGSWDLCREARGVLIFFSREPAGNGQPSLAHSLSLALNCIRFKQISFSESN